MAAMKYQAQRSNVKLRLVANRMAAATEKIKLKFPIELKYALEADPTAARAKTQGFNGAPQTETPVKA